MALHTTANTLFGAPTSISIGPWVTAKGAGTLVEIGHTKGGVSIKHSIENHEMEVDDILTPHRAIPIKTGYEIKFTMAEVTLENLRIALSQPAANLTGTPPDEILAVDGNLGGEVYNQVELVGPGLGTTGVRTIVIWRAVIKEVAEILWNKIDDRVYEVTLLILYEETGTGSDTIMQATDS